MGNLSSQHCVPCEGNVTPLDQTAIRNLLPQLSKDWQIGTDHKHIYRDFHFKNFYQTMGFVNAIAWMANLENHHPDLEVGFNHCLVRYTTHAIKGLSQNDFICAQKVDALFQPLAEKLK